MSSCSTHGLLLHVLSWHGRMKPAETTNAWMPSRHCPLDLSPSATLWYLRLWHLLTAENFAFSDDLGMMMRSTNGESPASAAARDNRIMIAMHLLNFRVMAMAKVLGGIADMMNLRELAKLVGGMHDFEEKPLFLAACAFFLCDEHTDAQFDWVRNPFEQPPSILSLFFINGLPRDLAEPVILPDGSVRPHRTDFADCAHAVHTAMAVACAALDALRRGAEEMQPPFNEHGSDYTAMILGDPDIQRNAQYLGVGLQQLRMAFFCSPTSMGADLTTQATKAYNRLGIGYGYRTLTNMVEAYNAWRRALQVPTTMMDVGPDHPQLGTFYVLCDGSKAVRDMKNCLAAFVVVPRDRRMLEAMKAKNTADSRRIDAEMEHALASPYCDVDHYVTHLKNMACQPAIDPRVMLMMLTTLTSPTVSDAWSIFKHVMDGIFTAEPLQGGHYLKFDNAGLVRRMNQVRQNLACIGDVFGGSGKYGFLGRDVSRSPLAGPRDAWENSALGPATEMDLLFDFTGGLANILPGGLANMMPEDDLSTFAVLRTEQPVVPGLYADSRLTYYSQTAEQTFNDVHGSV